MREQNAHQGEERWGCWADRHKGWGLETSHPEQARIWETGPRQPESSSSRQLRSAGSIKSGDHWSAVQRFSSKPPASRAKKEHNCTVQSRGSGAKRCTPDWLVCDFNQSGNPRASGDERAASQDRVLAHPVLTLQIDLINMVIELLLPTPFMQYGRWQFTWGAHNADHISTRFSVRSRLPPCLQAVDLACVSSCHLLK